MKKIVILIVILLATLSLITPVTGCQQKSQPSSSVTGDIRMTVTINGLEKGEEAILTISHEGNAEGEELLFVQAVKSDGEESITVDIGTSLKDGYYQLLLEAPDKYFREPKGCFFMVSQSKIVNPSGRNIIFNLLPQPEGLVAEAYISLSAPPKQPPPPPPFEVSVAPEEAHYLPGEPVGVNFSLNNVSSNPIKLALYPPEIQVKPTRQERLVFSVAAGTQSLEIKPNDSITLDFTWDQKNAEEKQVSPGWYNITFKDITVIYETDRRIVANPTARILIQYPKRTMEKTIELNQSQTENEITVILERIELTATGMTVYGFGTLPCYAPPPAASPFMHVFAEYSVDGNAVKQAGSAGMQELENGTRFIWSRYVDPVPSDAKELVFSISTITLSFAPDKPDELVVGPWVFQVPLE